MSRFDKLSVFGSLVSMLIAGGAHAAAPAAKCEAAKLKIAGAYGLCRLNAQAKSVKLGSGSETSGQLAKCDASFAKKWARAEKAAHALCPTSGDAGQINWLATQFSTSAVATLEGARFVDNGDGTISDTRTYLMWEKKDAADGKTNYGDPHDADNDYMWTNVFQGSAADGTVFTDFLSRLNACESLGVPFQDTVTGGFAGYCDWRLPTISELQTILDLTATGCAAGSSPCINAAFLPVSTFARQYWSSTTLAQYPPGAWWMDFDLGSAESVGKTNPAFVRAVRDNPLRYIDYAGPTRLP